MASLEIFLLVFTPLFVILNPLGAVPAFLSLTEAFKRSRIRIAAKVALTALAVLVFFAITGMQLFKFLGITIPAFRIAGGLILLRVAFEMIKGETRTLHSSHYSEDDISVMPLAIPLIAGPGAITTIVVLMNDHPGQQFEVFAALLCVIVLTFFILASSKWILRVIKERGLRVLIRLFGIILTATSVQFILTGIRDSMPFLLSLVG